MPPTQAYRPDPRILILGDEFYDPVEAAQFPTAIPRFRNLRWATRIGLSEIDWEAHFCRFEPLPGNLTSPLALRYHGHQFRHYNPDLGDGRGFLFAQLRDDHDRLLDFGTKGSGQTPWSRTADGRLTLKGGVREVLATEMLEALGVNTSKSFALFETGEALVRGDEPSPTRSAVLTRLGHGHIRIGSFQRLAFFEKVDDLDRLTRYCLEQLYGEQPIGEPAADALRLFERVADATARLAASYLAAGFVHGVLNTDNIAISGESFDYGPWRFTPDWEPAFTAAYFDHSGLSAFGRQPEAIQWNLAQFAGCLALVAEAKDLADRLDGWGEQFHRALVEALIARLGIGRLGIVRGEAETDRELARLLIAALGTRKVGIDRLFFDWRGGRIPAGQADISPEFAALAKALGGRRAAADHPYWADEAPCSMPVEEVETIWEAIAGADDWGPFEAKIAAIRKMGEAMTADRPLAAA